MKLDVGSVPAFSAFPSAIKVLPYQKKFLRPWVVSLKMFPMGKTIFLCGGLGKRGSLFGAPAPRFSQAPAAMPRQVGQSSLGIMPVGGPVRHGRNGKNYESKCACHL